MAEDLIATANRLSAKGKGLLASDESTGTIGKRLERAGLDNSEDARRAYRELFYTATIGDYISGVILFKEALYQSSSDGTPFVECLKRQGVEVGIKVDEGLTPLEGGREGETSTRGLENLAKNAKEYYNQGARFAKWRAALKIGDGCPSERAVEVNAEQLAEYAVICQAAGLVPIVEPEILIDGTHTIQQFSDVSEHVIARTVSHLWRRGVLLEGSLLKPQMIVPGADWVGPKPPPEEVATQTLRVMRRVVPPAIPGIMFLSGGQTEEECTVNLNTINRKAQAEGRAPWALSFSFGRGLQASVLKIWSTDKSRPEEAKQMVVALAKVNSLATQGLYEGPHPSITSEAGSLREDFRGWRTDVPAENGK